MNKTYSLFACCIPINGYRRSIVLDIQRETFSFIPNVLYEILKSKKIINEKKLIKEFCENDEDIVIIKEYLSFLIENEFVFDISPEIENCFPDLSNNWENPHEITNSIIDINHDSNFDFENIFNQLISLSCYNLQLRFYYEISLEALIKIIELVIKFNFRTLNIITKYNNLFFEENTNELLIKYPIIQTIIIYSSNLNKVHINKETSNNIIFSNETISPSDNCGIVSPNYFILNQKHFLESQHYDTCLNCKICIDIKGEIKNCPSMHKSFGNIKNSTLKEALEKPDFKDLWSIKKDDIEVCKDCEFRYMCTDCRAFIKNTNNIYSQPVKCTYNPYIAKWEGEKDYITIEEWRKTSC